MAMGRRWKQAKQERLWVATAELPLSASHPCYSKLNEILGEAGFDEFVEAQWPASTPP